MLTGLLTCMLHGTGAWPPMLFGEAGRFEHVPLHNTDLSGAVTQCGVNNHSKKVLHRQSGSRHKKMGWCAASRAHQGLLGRVNC